MPDPILSQRRRDDGLRFVRRMYLPRALGIALGGFCVGGVLWGKGASVAVWAALVGCALFWPHLAYFLARRSRDPYRAERKNLAIDSALGGAWIALMQFNLLPSMLLLTMLSMDKLAVGSWPFLGRCTLALLAGCAASGALFGFAVEPGAPALEIVASLPLLVVYPMTVGVITYRLARRVRNQNRLLAEMSRTDGLTRLLNRRSWEEAVRAEFEHCIGNARRATLLMLDIDHFKAVNDRHGHPAGDEVIRSIAAILRAGVRQQDVPGRYGGEEFGVLLPETNAAGAQAIAERLRRRIESTPLGEHGIRSTASIGIAELDPKDGEYATWLAHADRALYAAKEQGRNRSVTYEPR